MKYKITLLGVIAVFISNPLQLQAQRKNISTVGNQKVVISKRVNDPVQPYSSTIDLNDNHMQLIMAGQNYQTNYGIYAKIAMVESNMGPEYKTLEKIEFELVNYKPTYFIGIDSVNIVTTKALDGITLNIYTRALSDMNTYTLESECLKNIHFEKGSYLHSQRILNPMFPEFDVDGRPILMSDGRVTCKADNGKAFDFEFFYKDGSHVVRKEAYDLEVVNTQRYKNESISALPSKRCWTSYNKIIF